MFASILDLAATVGPAFAAAVILLVLTVPCVVVDLVLKKPHTGKKVSVRVLGKLVTVDVEDTPAAPVALPPAAPDGLSQPGSGNPPVINRGGVPT
ncbi:hypothetical protein JNUCC0626_47465 [Lentzea sp. JNUCC 0626]|uniref:hypothetical protein n=1 Tax=Lentzea sp. JNUCC 0626 TaxID=3367513 RepID=UPI003747AA69